MSRRWSSPGFTLIELSLLLVLFALLSALAIPSFSGTLSRARTRAALDRLAGDLFLARSLAARSGRPLRVRFGPAGECADFYEITGDTGVLRRVTVRSGSAGVCLSSNVPGAMRVNSRGMLVGSPRTVWARSGGEADSATISIVGRVYRWR
jgi:type II secretory pathway pseudopilin PulG